MGGSPFRTSSFRRASTRRRPKSGMWINVPFIQPTSAQNSRMFEGEDTQEDVERHVTEWIMEHKEQWKAWLREASQASD